MGDVQLLKPGERAPAHRHTTSSIRLSLEGSGGYTMVDGEKCVMERGDIIVNPIWAWHHHGNEGTQDVIWVDVLDVPLVTALGSTKYDYDYAKEGDKEDRYVSVREDSNRSEDLFGVGGLLPRFGTARAKWHNTQVCYKWRNTIAALNRMKRYSGDPYEGVAVEFVNPATGRSVIPTMSLSMHLIRAGEALKTHRHTASSVYCVVQGEGYTEAGGETLKWRKNDLFVIPTWTWHRHVNTSTSGDAILFRVTDAPVGQMLRLYRFEERSEAGEPVAIMRERAQLPDYIHRMG
jgi:gentisate 1,2-dioxygenase